MLCSQRGVQTSGILTLIERDKCLRNSLSVCPMLIMGRNYTLCMILTTDLDFCPNVVDNIHSGRSTSLGIIWARFVFQVFHSLSVSLGKSYYFSEQQLHHPQMEPTWDQIRCSLQVFCLMWNIIQIRNCYCYPKNISRSERWKYIYFIRPAKTENILQVP